VEEMNGKENGMMKLTNGSATANGNGVGSKMLVNGHRVEVMANGDEKVPLRREGKKHR
jgi:hypothetical protein